MSEAILPLRTAAPPRFSEDLVAVGLGLVVFLLALGSLAGADALGWLVTTSVWTAPSTALAPVSKAYASLGGAGSLLATYLVLTGVLSAAAYLLGDDVKRFAAAFTAVFVIAYASWFVGSWAYLAAVTPADQAKFGVSWSLKLTNEGGSHAWPSGPGGIPRRRPRGRGRLHRRASRWSRDRERLPGFR